MRLSKRLYTIIIMAFFLSTTGYANSAYVDYHTGRYQQARPLLEQLVAKKNPQALYYLGTMYLYGYAVGKDVEQGIQLITQAAEKKYLPAQIYLGKYYLLRKHDTKVALTWFTKAANQSDTQAQMYTALAYIYGIGAKKNYDRARKYIIEAAKKGIVMAQYELGIMFAQSKYRSDRKMGAIWLKKAAEKGYGQAQYQLGLILSQGTKDIKADATAAEKWLKKAAESGNPNAKQRLAMNAQGENGVTANAGVKAVKAEAANVSAENNWQKMVELLAKANIKFRLPIIATAKVGQVTITPRLVFLTKQSLIKADYRLVQIQDIPMSDIISYVTKLRYQHEKPTIFIQQYKFSLPINTKTEQEAVLRLAREAKFGHPQAQFQLGQMYEQGIGVKKDLNKAFSLFAAAAQHKFQKAEYKTAIYYLQGKVVPKDYQKAVDLLHNAAIQGSVPAQFVLGGLYEYGFGSQQEAHHIAINLKRAKSMYSLAAHHGFGLAQYRLAQLYASGLLNPQQYYEQQYTNQRLALKLYQAAVKQGIAKAKLPVAFFMAANYPDQQQAEKIFDYVEDLAYQDNKDARLLLAVLYARGIGTRQSTSRAMKQFRVLAKSGNIFAEFALGTYDVLNENKNRGLQLLQKAAEKNSQYAQYNLAILAKQGDYQHADADFLSLLHKAVASGYNRADLLLADYYLSSSPDSKNIKKSAQIYRKLAAKQNAAAELKLGLMYDEGILFNQNNQQALKWYTQSAHHHSKVAQYLVGYAYLAGKGVAHNPKRALKYLHQAARQGFLPAEVGLGFTYEIAQQDYKNAFSWYEKSAEKNNPQGLFDLALVYKYGKGVKPSQRKANKLYKKSKLSSPLWQ